MSDGPVLTVASGNGSVLEFSPTEKGSARYRALIWLRAHQLNNAQYAERVEVFK